MLITDVHYFKPILREIKEKPGIFEVEGVLQRAGVQNQNGRVYSKSLLEREVNRYLREFISQGNAYGELDHPESEIVSMKNASHIVKKLWWSGDDLIGVVELLNTPCGNIVKNILKDGHTIGISSRGTGSVNRTNEGYLQVEPDFELICWDFVSNPSTHGAFMNPVTLNEGKSPNPNIKLIKINQIINEILYS